MAVAAARNPSPTFRFSGVANGVIEAEAQACTSVGVCASALVAAIVAVMVAVTELHHCQAAVGTSMGLPRTVRPLPSWTTGATSLLPLLAGSLWGASTRPMTDRRSITARH